MRLDDPDFAAANTAESKEPRLVVRIIFDVASIYATSRADMVNVPGTALLGHLQGLSAVSQQINPDEGRSTIGSMSFSIVDLDEDLSGALRTQLIDETQNLRERRVELRLGYTDDFDDTIVLFTQQVSSLEHHEGVYSVGCQDIQRETRIDILEPKRTNLRLSVDADDTTIPVQDTTGFELVFHGTSYSDAPSATVLYFRIEDEIIRATGKSADSFTGCTRGVFNTIPAAHEVNAGADADRQPSVEEFIYLELPGPKLAYALLTGVLLDEAGSPTIPAHWHMGVATTDVALTQFQNIGPDLYANDAADDNGTIVLRFAGLTKTNGKRFLEEQVYQPLGIYSPVLADGRLGLRRMNPILADAPYVAQWTEDSFVQIGALEHDFQSLINIATIDWNYDPITEEFTRRIGIVDQDSIDVHGEAEPKRFEWQGLHGSRHTDTVLQQRMLSIRDRYSGPPLRMSGELLHSYNVHEVGDVVRVTLPQVRDYTGSAGGIDRSMEIQRIAVDQFSGRVSVQLFGSSQAAAITAPETAANPIPDAWYDSQGVALSSVVTISSNVIQPGTYTLTGSAQLDGDSVFYHEGDLELADGATLNIDDNVQLRIRGFFTVNGDINGAGRGQAGIVDDGDPGTGELGQVGFIGNTRPWDGAEFLEVDFGVGGAVVVDAANRPTKVTQGLHSSFPFLQLSVNSTPPPGALNDVLIGLPLDLRGTSGARGGRIFSRNTGADVADGGDGGDGGSGLAIICRGMAVGPSASINLSGGDSALGDLHTASNPDFRAGAGAPGGPGACLVLLDGSALTVPGVLGIFTASWGDAPESGTFDAYPWALPAVPGIVLMGTNDSIENASSAASVLRIQHVPGEQDPEEDIAVVAPVWIQIQDGYDRNTLQTIPPPPGVITEFYASITDNRADALLIGSTDAGRFVHPVTPDITHYYWARNRDIATRLVSLFAPDTSTSSFIGVGIQHTGANIIRDSRFTLQPNAETGEYWVLTEATIQTVSSENRVEMPVLTGAPPNANRIDSRPAFPVTNGLYMMQVELEFAGPPVGQYSNPGGSTMQVTAETPTGTPVECSLVSGPGSSVVGGPAATLDDSIDVRNIQTAIFRVTSASGAVRVFARITQKGDPAGQGTLRIWSVTVQPIVNDALDAHAKAGSDLEPRLWSAEKVHEAARAAQEFDVRRFGAVVDGSTDDSSAIQAAITAAVSSGGGKVLLPPGTMRCDSNLLMQSNVALVGHAHGSHLEFNGAALKWDGLAHVGTLPRHIAYSDLHDVRVSRIGTAGYAVEIVGWGGDGTAGSVEDVFRFSVRRLSIIGSTGGGLRMAGAYIGNFYDTHIRNCSGIALKVEDEPHDPGGLETGVNAVHFWGGEFQGNGKAAECERLLVVGFHGMTIEGNTVGFDLLRNNSQVVFDGGGYWETNGSYDIRVGNQADTNANTNNLLVEAQFFNTPTGAPEDYAIILERGENIAINHINARSYAQAVINHAPAIANSVFGTCRNVRHENPPGTPTVLDGADLNFREGLPERVITASALWNPAAIAAAGKAEVNVSVTGAALGDFVLVAPSGDVQNLQLTGYVSSANNVRLTLHNNHTAAINIGELTYRIVVIPFEQTWF